MDEFQKCMFVDKLIIIMGVLGVLIPLVMLIMALNGKIVMQLTTVFFMPLGAFFIYYGIRQMRKDKEMYHRK